MRPAAAIPIRRVARGTYYGRKIPFNPESYPTSPAIEDLLSQPTWSVRSLLPPSKRAPIKPKPKSSSQSPEKTSPTSQEQEQEQPTPEITPSKLHHLLRLSALPPPKTALEEAQMLETLRSQIHFVKAIQTVDTTDIEPLITIRDETREAVAETAITLEKMMPYLELEEKVGKNGTVRRRDVVRSEEQDRVEREKWEVDVGDLGEGSERRRMGRYFYVKRGKKDREGKPVGR